MRFLLLPFIFIAGVGLALALATHFVAMFAHQVLISRWLLQNLFNGIFACALPMIVSGTVLHHQRPALRGERNGVWSALLSGGPRWFYCVSFGLVAYAVIFSLWLVAFGSSSPSPQPSAPRTLTWIQARNLSVGPITFYGILLPLFVSIFRRPGLLREEDSRAA